MKTKNVKFNKEIADKILAKESKNRLLKLKYAELLARDMRNGDWMQDTGDAIRFNSDGDCIDGQHRLKAVSLADVEIMFLVHYDIDNSVMPFIDIGKKRNGSDILNLNGVSNASTCASIISKIINFNPKTFTVAKKTSSNHKILSKYNESPAYFDNLTVQSRECYSNFGRGMITTTLIGYWMHHFNNSNIIESYNFFLMASLNDGGKNSPTNTLNKVLRKNTLAVKRLPEKVISAYIVKSWNAFIDDRQVKVLRWNPEKDTFPTIKK